MITAEEKIKRIRIGDTDVFLEDFEVGQGKITISNTDNRNYSHYWGSMGNSDLKNFICSINAEYFAGKLMGRRPDYVMDVPKTFAAIRKSIATDLELPWYKHPAFQKDMREKLNDFQRDCESHKSKDLFVERFHNWFVSSLHFYLIEDRHERKCVEKTFNDLSEVWNYIQETEGPEYLWLLDFHKKLKSALLNQ